MDVVDETEALQRFFEGKNLHFLFMCRLLIQGSIAPQCTGHLKPRLDKE